MQIADIEKMVAEAEAWAASDQGQIALAQTRDTVQATLEFLAAERTLTDEDLNCCRTNIAGAP